MSEPMTQREAALAARVRELEQAQAVRGSGRSAGGVVDQIWGYITYLLPLPIIALGVAAFVGFHAWQAYNHGLQLAAETRLKAAQASVKQAEADANAFLVDGKPLRVEMLREEVTKKQQEALKAKVEADALNTIVDGVAAETKRVQLEVENKELAAKKAQQEASALGQTDEKLRTMAERLALAQVKLTDLQALETKLMTAGQRAVGMHQDISDGLRPVAAEICRGPYARDVRCGQLKLR